MSYRVKEKIVMAASGIILFCSYAAILYAGYFGKNPELLNDFSFWGKAVLIFMGISIVARILIMILFTIVNMIVTRDEDEPPKMTDERDKIIELKATRVSMFIFVFGFLTGMVFIASGLPGYSMFFAFFGFGLVAELLSDITAIRYYQQGF